MADEFRTTQVAERYAQALFDLADETGAIDAVRADLKSLRAAWHESADLRRLANSPVISSEDQQKGLVAIADKAKFNKTTRNFLGLLARTVAPPTCRASSPAMRRCMPRRPAWSPPRSSRPRP